MTKPRHNVVDAVRFGSRGRFRAVDHDDEQPKLTRGGNFGIGTCTARVLRNHDVDLMVAQKLQVLRLAERAFGNDGFDLRQGDVRPHRINQPQEIVVLGLRSKRADMHAANGQKHTGRSAIQRSDRTHNVRHAGPHIAVGLGPRRAGQSQERDVCVGAGLNGVTAHLRGKGVGGVNHVGNGLGFQMLFQSRRAAKTANARGQRHGDWAFDAPSKRQGGSQPGLGDGGSQQARFGCSTQDQDVWCHV